MLPPPTPLFLRELVMTQPKLTSAQRKAYRRWNNVCIYGGLLIGVLAVAAKGVGL